MSDYGEEMWRGNGEGIEEPTGERLWQTWDKLAQKEGERHTVYWKNGEQYRGEWVDNKKQGKGQHIYKNKDKYEGEWLDGKRGGHGTLWKYVKGGKYRVEYNGQWLNDMKHGYGVYYNEKRDRYEGEFFEDLRQGKGKQYYGGRPEDGFGADVYDGDWFRGKRHGKGTMTYGNGDMYVGGWANDMKEGEGVFFYLEKKKRYDGVWHEDTPKNATDNRNWKLLPPSPWNYVCIAINTMSDYGEEMWRGNGEGIEEPTGERLWQTWDKLAQKEGERHTVYWKNGEQYRGEWVDNKKQGKGQHIYKNKDKYEGEWLDGKRGGHGTLWKYVKGGKYRVEYNGQWLNDMKHGYGVYYNEKRDRYEGEFFEDLRQGKGKQYYGGRPEDGFGADVYDGDWFRGKRHGKGTMTYGNGDMYVGGWANDMKEGEGVFFYLEKKKRYDGVWHEDTPKCGSYGTHDPGAAGQGDAGSSIPALELVDADKILKDRMKQELRKNQMELSH
eukprot:jgi/Mesvir1/11815/Mv00172-RA.1